MVELRTQTRVLASVLVVQCMAGKVATVVNITTSASLQLKLTQRVMFATAQRSLMVVSGEIPLGGGGQNNVNAIQASLLEETVPSVADIMETDTSPPTLLRLHADVRDLATVRLPHLALFD